MEAAWRGRAGGAAPYRVERVSDDTREGHVEDSDAGLAWEILQRYVDAATPEFDAALEAAGLPAEVARTLRFWHRESIANVKQYASEVLPAMFALANAAERDAAEATRRAGAAFKAEHQPRTPGTSPWALPRPAEDVVITIPDSARETLESPSLLEARRRTVAARLADLG
jgi:hypothetical protein